MAENPNIINAQSVQNSQQILDNTNKLKDALSDVLFMQRDFAEEAKKAAKAAFENNIQASATYKSFKDLSIATKAISSTYADIVKGQKSLRELQKDITLQDKARKSFLIEAEQSLKKSGFSQEEINKSLSNQGSIADLVYEKIGGFNEEQLDLLMLYDEQNKLLKEQEQDLSQIQEQAKKINNAFGVLGNTVEGVGEGLSKTGFGNLSNKLGLSDAVTKTREYAAQITKGGTNAATLGDKFKIAGNLAKNVGGNLIKSLGPLPLIIAGVVKIAQFFVGAMFDASKLIAEFQRDMGLTADEAENVRQRTYDIAQNSSLLADTQGRILINQKQIVQSQKEINDALDTQMDLTQDLGRFGQELLTQSSILRDNFGLGGEAIAEINKESIRTGESVEDITKNTFGTVAAIGLEKGILLDVNKILTEATKIQGNLRLSFKGSTSEIANAVAQSKLLGLTLQQNANIADSLLDFEQSISSEMEAELLTGRELNLEKARLAAINGDFLQVGKEINAQGITYNNLQKMNLIQRKAIAGALGLSVDELADATKQQQEYNALQARALIAGVKISDLEKKTLKELYDDNKALGRSEEEVVAVLGKEIFARKQAEDAQTKFNNALEAAKESFAKLAQPGGTIDKFAEILTKFISSISSGKSIVSALFSDYRTDEEKKEEDGKTQAMFLGYNPNKPTSPPDEAHDFIIRPGQKPLKYNKDDIIIGGTKLTGGNDNSEVTSLLKELIVAVKSGGNIYLDGTKVGTAMAVSTYRVQ
jgi:hypothetical protein